MLCKDVKCFCVKRDVIIMFLHLIQVDLLVSSVRLRLLKMWSYSETSHSDLVSTVWFVLIYFWAFASLEGAYHL